MGIRKKTILSIFIAVVISIGLFYQVADHAIDTRFTALEKQQAQTRLNYALRLMENSRDGLHLLVRDWGLWNDTYAFVENPNAEFIESNLVKETFSDTGLSYIGFFPLKGDSAWEGFYDHATKKMSPLPHALTQTLERLLDSLRQGGAESKIQPGFFVTNGTFHVIAASPILKSDESGPSRGWIVMVQPLDNTFFKDLFTEESTEVTVATRPAPGDGGTVHFHFSDNRARYACSGTVNDILGNATVEVTLTGSSNILLEGKRLLSLTGAGITLTGLLLALLTYLLIQRTLLKRILTLSQQVAPVAMPDAPVVNVHPHGDDELSGLAVDINAVFKRIIEEECLNRTILTALNIGVLIIDGQSGTVRDINLCMEKMTGKHRTELLGLPADTLFHPLSKEEQSHAAPHREKGILLGNASRHIIRTRTATRYHDTPIRIETFTDIQALESEVEDVM